MKTKRKFKGTRNPLFLHINNLINRKDYFCVVLLLCSYHHVVHENLLKLLLFRFYSSFCDYLNSSRGLDDVVVNYDSVLNEIKSQCHVCPSIFYCIEYLFKKYSVMKGGVL